MGQDFDARFPRFHIGPYDRVIIHGRPFRLVQQMSDAFVLRPETGDQLVQTFAYEELNRLSAEGRVRHEIDAHLPASMRVQTKGGAADFKVGALSEAPKRRLDVRYALVEAFKELYAEHRVLKTEASVAGCLDEICDRARPYLEREADLLAADREERAKAGKGRRKMGGTLAAGIVPPHARTLLEWVRAEAADGKVGLVDAFARRGNRKSRFTVEESALLMSTVESSYLNFNRPTKATTVADVRVAFGAENERRAAAGLAPLRVPSREAVNKCIDRLDPFLVTVARFGIEEATKQFRPVGRGVEVSRPLERVEIDEWRIDLISIMTRAGLMSLFTEEEMRLMGLDDAKARWWIVAAIDRRTRIILGTILTRETKTSAAAACLRMVVSDKGAISDATGAAARWSQFGTPETLVADNGSAFKATSFTDTCNDLGVTLVRTIAGAPSMRGVIERVFLTCAMGLLPRLSGRTFSDVVTKGEHPSMARACLTPEDLCTVLVRWIVDIYHNTEHSGLGGRTPLQQWEADHREGNYPLRAAPDRRSKRLAFGMPLRRRASTEGVTVLGVRYHSPDLAAFVLRQGERDVDLRWDAEDIGAIEVRIGDEWCEVPAVHAGLEGVHAQVWIAARRALRTESPRERLWREEAIQRAIEAISATNEHRSLQFGLIDKAYNARQIDELEAGLFDGFKVTANTALRPAEAGGRGRSIMPRPPEDEREAPGRPGLPAADDDWAFET